MFIASFCKLKIPFVWFLAVRWTTYSRVFCHICSLPYLNNANMYSDCYCQLVVYMRHKSPLWMASAVL